MAVKVGSFAKSTSLSTPVTQVVTGVGFRPKALLLWTVGATAVDMYAGGIRNAIGMTDGTTQGSCAASLDDATANANAGRKTARKALTICDGDGATLAECDLTFGGDGFTLSWTTNDATAYLINYMAIGGVDLTNVKVLEWQLATSTGNQAVAGVGFQPDAMIGICGNRATLGTGTTKAILNVWVGVGTGGWSGGWVCADNSSSGAGYAGVGSSDAHDYNPTTDYNASLIAVGADGFTYGWDVAAADTFYAYQLCLKGGSYAQGYTTKSTGAAPATQTINSLGFNPDAVLLALGNSTGGQYGICLTVGASDGVAERCGAITDEYAAATIEAKHFASDSQTLVQDYSEGSIKPDQTTDSAADLSLVSGGFSLVWNPNQAKASKLGYLALATGTGDNPDNLQASGASTSAGMADLRIGQSLVATGASTSVGSADLKNSSPDDVLVTQAGLLIDVERTAPELVTQAGALVDVLRVPPINVTQAGALLDVERTPPIQVTQAGVIVDVDSIAPIRVTQAGLMIDARYQRPESLLNCWEFHVLDPNTHYLTFLDAAFSKAYMGALSDCGGGKFTIHRDDPKATATNLAVGNVVMVRYKNVDVGAWVMENFEETLVDQGEGPAEVFVVSGRGLLGFLDKGLVYPSDLADAGTAERAFDGKTNAEIFLTLYNEYLLRGGGELDVDFTAVNDSRALPWTDSAYLKFKAGQTLLDVARNLAGLGMELTVDPDRTLRAWNQAGTDLSATIHFREGQNLLSSRLSTEGTGLANVVLGEGQGIFVETKDLPSIASHHRRETYLSVRNTADTGQIATANTILLNGWAEPRAALTLEVLSEPFYPFFDYGIGDVVHIDVPGDIDADYRVLAIAIDEKQGPCDLRVTLSINDLATEYLQRLQRAFDASLSTIKPGPGASGSLASSGTEPVVGASGTGMANGAIKNNHIDWGLGADQVDAADVPITDAGNYYTGNQVEAALQELGAAAGTIVTDHGGLSGLGDDDHAQYLLATGARDGATSGAQQFTNGVSTGDAFYLGSPTADGSWRIVKSGNNLAFERRETGSWVSKGIITA